jgi:hypothetical protein
VDRTAPPQADAGQPSSDAGAASGDARGDDAADANDGATSAQDGGPPQAIGLAMYMYPSPLEPDWAQAYAAAPTVAILIADPYDGPGPSLDDQYTQAIAAARVAGQTIVGYVHTSWGARALSAVETDVDTWYALYPDIDGIFIDETWGTRRRCPPTICPCTITSGARAALVSS